MDITLIPEAESTYNRKLQRKFISDDGMVRLTDCTLVLLHKSGMRPLYLMEEKSERALMQPEHTPMAKPDLILFSNIDTGVQSARVVQEQLKRCECEVKMLGTDFSMIDRTKNPTMLKNMLLKRAQNLKEKGYQHIVVIADSEYLDKIAYCMNEKGLNSSYNIPIFSFSDGKEIDDINLTKNLYITRDLLDNYLIGKVNRSDSGKLTQFKGKCQHPLEIYQLRSKLHLPE